eukprot:CAMPEP_0194726274 /NCGR_PEP_ID=MMETSP0296-20130528/30393_1 /TAXON_ID=39354 /ORGANISM="Heterosigma akashiwo, Strain CCMP2393" /LENGTH=177 /DNA_ID=CAMNT_0039631161 /DNA_START=153 /DNA_END=686 /DNA_ORIENTATION=+
MTQVNAAEGDKLAGHVFPRPLLGGMTRCTPIDQGRVCAPISQLPPPTVKERNPLNGYTCLTSDRRSVKTEFDKDCSVVYAAPFLFPAQKSAMTRSRAPSSGRRGSACLYGRTHSVSFKTDNACVYSHLEWYHVLEAIYEKTCKITKEVTHVPLRAARRGSWEYEKLLEQQMSATLVF